MIIVMIKQNLQFLLHIIYNVKKNPSIMYNKNNIIGLIFFHRIDTSKSSASFES